LTSIPAVGGGAPNVRVMHMIEIFARLPQIANAAEHSAHKPLEHNTKTLLEPFVQPQVHLPTDQILVQTITTRFETTIDDMHHGSAIHHRSDPEHLTLRLVHHIPIANHCWLGAPLFWSPTRAFLQSANFIF